METAAHLRLKKLALAFLRQQGCLAAMSEVRCPISRFRVDAVGYMDRPPLDQQPDSADRRMRPIEPKTIVIECKQSRSDFLRDSEVANELIALRTQMDRIRRSIEEYRIKREEPQLQQTGTSLFAELEEWDFASSRLPSYRKILRRLRRLDAKLHGETKFFLMARYRLADQLYIAAPQGVIRKCELPAGWGLLECPLHMLQESAESDGADQPPMLRISVEAPFHASRPEYRTRFLRNIAVAASLAVQRYST